MGTPIYVWGLTLNTYAPPNLQAHHRSTRRRIPSRGTRYGYRHVGISAHRDGSKGTNHHDGLEDVSVSIKRHHAREHEGIIRDRLPTRTHADHMFIQDRPPRTSGSAYSSSQGTIKASKGCRDNYATYLHPRGRKCRRDSRDPVDPTKSSLAYRDSVFPGVQDDLALTSRRKKIYVGT